MSFDPDTLHHPKAGKPSLIHLYRDRGGQPVLAACRYHRQDDGKFFLPHDIRTAEWKAPQTRPLYNLDQITRQPDKVVVLAEGEKCADALIGLGLLATTTFGGSNAASKADMSPLSGRKVVIWPDHDEPGRKYQDHVAESLAKLKGTKVYALTISDPELQRIAGELAPSPIPAGWDAADAVAAGWQRGEIETLLRSAERIGQTSPISLKKAANSAEITELWHTANGEAFATIDMGSHRENWPLDSRKFATFLAYEHYRSEGKSPSAAALEDKRRTLAGQAEFEGPEYPVYSRTGGAKDQVILDLGHADWGCIQIASDGWQPLAQAPQKFQRSAGMEALPMPDAPHADIDALRPFLNTGSEGDFRMLVAWLLGCFQPSGPYPILILIGEQGSAKSTTSRILRKLIDPARPMSRSTPQSEQDLVIAARNSHVLAFDNLSYIKPSLADAFCRMATGGGFGTRKLHTNAEEVLFDVTRPCLLNGIPDLASRADLADRAIVVHLPVISGAGRRYERDLWAEFDHAAPAILAALLNAVSCALKHLPTATLSERPRLADFARWVTAAEPALGWPKGAFLQAYAENRDRAAQAPLRPIRLPKPRWPSPVSKTAGTVPQPNF